MCKSISHGYGGSDSGEQMEIVSRVVDNAGNTLAVQIPWKTWQRIAPVVEPLLAPATPRKAVKDRPEPMDAFEEFLQYWTFRYPYSPAVACPHCGEKTENWREDPRHPFKLANANIGGLLVFHCIACGTTIRLKHFKDHVAVEHTPAGNTL